MSTHDNSAPSVRAIETVYSGHRFRSRLEARWAVFFDALEIRYQYEPEGYDLDGTWYIPDFWLPDLKCWIEAKGVIETDAAAKLVVRKASRLAERSGYPVFLFLGECALPVESEDSHWKNAAYRFPEFRERVEQRYVWAECVRCQTVGVDYYGCLHRIGCECPENQILEGRRSPRIQAAFAVAKAIRFDAPEVKEKLTPNLVCGAAITAWTQGFNKLMESDAAMLAFQRQVHEYLGAQIFGEED